MSKIIETSLAFQNEILMNQLSERIYNVRGYQVMLDFDLAKIYEIPNKVMKQAVRRNIECFPSDLMFEMTKVEVESLRSQIVTSNDEKADLRPCLRSQSVTSKNDGCDYVQSGRSRTPQIVFSKQSGRGGTRYAPFAFTESGVAMLATVLGGQRALQVSISIVRAFAHFRQQMIRFESMLVPKLEAWEKRFESFENALIVTEKRYGSLENSFADLSQKFDRFIDSHQTQKTIAMQPRTCNKVEAIKRAVAKHYGRQVEELKSPMRDRAISQARQIAIYFMRKHLGMTLTAIGYELGNRHHTTILYDCQKAYMDAEENETVRLIIGSVQNEIGSFLAA